jgi:hypothetical protein
MSDLVLHCPKCGSEKFILAPDGHDKPDSPITCGDCGHVAGLEAFKHQGLKPGHEAGADSVSHIVLDRRRGRR